MSLRRIPTNSNDPTSPRMFLDDQTGVIQTEGGTVVSDPTTLLSFQGINADGSINIKAGAVYVTKGTAANISLAAPKSGAQSAGGDDGRNLCIINQSGVAHIITTPANALNGNKTTLTMTAAVGVAILVAFAGKWWVAVASGTVS